MMSVPPSRRMPRSDGMRRRSTTCVGCAKRSFIRGCTLCPSNSILAFSPCSASKLIASSIVVGVDKSKDACYMLWSPTPVGGLHRSPKFVRGERHVDVLHTEWGERVDDRVHDGRRRRAGSCIAGAHDA